MSTIEHSSECVSANYCRYVFVPDCPKCRLDRAAPQLLEACKALLDIARYYPGDTNPQGDAEIDDAYALGRAAIVAAEAKE